MRKYGASSWKGIPFVRVLLPLVAGILTGFYLRPGPVWMVVLLLAGFTALLIVNALSAAKIFVYRWLPGLALHMVFFSLGCLLLWSNDVRNNDRWIGRLYKPGDAVIVTLSEPLVAKERSWKAVAETGIVVSNGITENAKGKIIVYFVRDSLPPAERYGSQLLITRPLQPILDAGNPGGFNYRAYCALSGIYHQVTLSPGNYQVLPGVNRSMFAQWLIDIRAQVLACIRKNVPGKDEAAVAEALLIGYKDDLDKDLVRSYSNTGVVHIIAISGLHLGMIYGLMVWLFSPFAKKRWSRLVKPLCILCVLWTFTFLAGAVPSILRSAVMFTCIVIGEALSRKRTMYNTLAASAFILLLWNPLYLWDVGFQLSFAAVMSIAAFAHHINNWFYFQNRILNKVWSLSAVTLSAQVLTLPVILYHFHRFPNLFLFTNMLIVPLSGAILFAELLLLIVSFVPLLATVAGKAIGGMVWLMNTIIERTDRIPFAVTDGIRITVLQSILMYLAIGCIVAWLLKKNRQYLLAGCASIAAFVLAVSIDTIMILRRQKLIVYNVPHHTAIDIVSAGHFLFMGDSELSGRNALTDLHLRLSRLVNGITEGAIDGVAVEENIVRSVNKNIVIIDRPLAGTVTARRIKADAVIIIKDPAIDIHQLTRQYDCPVFVFDGSNSSSKIRLWKKECDSLHLRFHSVPEMGAFEMDL